MSGFSFQVPARPEDVLPAYVFYGADLFPARKFTRELREALSKSTDEPARVESFSLTDRRWREVLDVAKTLALFDSQWRILAVEGKSEGLSASEATIISEYFASPSPKTTVILMFQGALHKTKPLGKALWALPSSAVRIAEITQMKDKDLKPLIMERFEALKKRPTSDAIDRILDVTGSDIARIDSEINKLDIYLGPRTTVEADDVSALSSVKSFHNWELNAALEAADIDKALVIINSLFENGEAAEMILAVLSGFFRDLLLAKSGLREGREPKDVFREVKPQISEKFGGFYQKMLGEYLGLLDRVKDKDLSGWLTELQEMDRKLKQTDVSPREMIQVFVVSYGRKMSGRRVTSSARR